MKGWHGESERHSLASKGIKTTTNGKTQKFKIDTDYIKSSLESINGILPKSVYVNEYPTEIEATFKLQDEQDIPSSIIYDFEEDMIFVTLRFKGAKPEDVAQYFPPYVRIHTGEGRDAVHIDFHHENTSPSDFIHQIEEMENWISSLKEGGHL